MSAEEYRRAMDALARETTMPPESAERIERQLLEAFASREDDDVAPSPRKKSVAWRPWLSAAAAIVLAAGTTLVWWMTHTTVFQHYDFEPRPATERPSAPATVTVESVKRPPVESGTASGPRSPHPNRTAQKTNVVTPSGFVDLPWTAGLPAFESGEIVRMDIPVASLPTYGIDISSGAGRGPVEADVLIGQDGFARAIRLVASNSRSTQ